MGRRYTHRLQVDIKYEKKKCFIDFCQISCTRAKLMPGKKPTRLKYLAATKKLARIPFNLSGWLVFPQKKKKQC